MVRVKAFEDEDDKIMIEVLVSVDDMGRVIGKKGMIANAIRTIVQASSYIHENRLITINIDSF
ncbi:MAG: KH domain-containing protein [Firmicutes bacterium]|nr:KH domain-containing protein [Bacillota bacterium]